MGGSIGDDLVGERRPAGRLLVVDGASGDGAQSGGADQPAVGPGIGFELPDAGVGIGLGPAVVDRLDRYFGGVPPVAVEVVVAGCGGEEQECFTERVELELLIDPVADNVAASRVAGQVELALVGYVGAGGRVGGLNPDSSVALVGGAGVGV